ncbi:MAG: hypothetical protein Q4G14_03295 [Paracoccus sp. (in: a-proteobacteria)]|uniref:hypothetical protein n=1 Tax=Paracoccus sp. TaxID=267 RepID=UPI0026E07EB4|nr:hypothetical protein [Paracoccus sp. (in: a-proteobacteria)]MDO5612251.1 hypothetical protein [Paracoccus sp. (in: a-proteobacteria)]
MASTGACYLAVAGAVLGTNRAVGGASEVITGQEQLTPAEWSAIKAGMKPEDARQLIGWVETGVATVTIVHGVAIITKGGAVITAKEVATNRPIGSLANEKVAWVDEGASMSPRARAYDEGAMGSRSNIETHKGQAPALSRTTSDGQTTSVRFDGVDGDVLIDRKLSVVTTQKAKDQVLRQSEALQQNGLTGRWEVPTQAQADRATRMFNDLNVSNITVRVVPE